MGRDVDRIVVKSKTISHSALINSPPSKVYDAITTKTGIQGWWTPDVIIEPRVGSIAEFIFKDRYHNKMEILDLQENKRVEWKCLEGDKEWIETHIIFELKSEGDSTLVTFNHANWKARTEFMDYCDQQWGKYLVSLKNYLETGIGNPF